MANPDPRSIRLIMALRTKGVADTATLAAIERTPRDVFVPSNFQDQAYEDVALPIGLGQTISQPLVVALMTQALEINDRHKVLEIGTGSGYQTAILSRLARRVYTIERHRPLLDVAEQRFAQMQLRNITTMAGDGMLGWPVQAPFDRIIVTAAATLRPPQALLDQLAIGGILVIPIALDGVDQVLRRYKRESDDVTAIQDICAVKFVPLLPDIATDDPAREEKRA